MGTATETAGCTNFERAVVRYNKREVIFGSFSSMVHNPQPNRPCYRKQLEQKFAELKPKTQVLGGGPCPACGERLSYTMSMKKGLVINN